MIPDINFSLNPAVFFDRWPLQTTVRSSHRNRTPFSRLGPHRSTELGWPGHRTQPCSSIGDPPNYGPSPRIVIGHRFASRSPPIP